MVVGFGSATFCSRYRGSGRILSVINKGCNVTGVLCTCVYKLRAKRRFVVEYIQLYRLSANAYSIRINL